MTRTAFLPLVIDSSALLAILRGEPEGPAFRNAIRTAPNRLLGALTRVEASLVALGRGEPGLEQMQALIEHWTWTWSRFRASTPNSPSTHSGALEKDGTLAGLNYGDIFSYALAKATGEPLLFKGDDFSQTDIRRAV